MGALASAIKEMGAAVDILGPQLGLSDTTINQIDVGIAAVAGAASNENPLIVASAAAIAVVAVGAIAPEALAAGVVAAVGEEALVGTVAIVDSMLATNLPTALAFTSGALR